ncbi:hypothetical protein AURDEDRAFT_119189 [Auricularia subglabra TFB-10046 SS5]|nr:hypothetical protein AURDEDRAFT_119189 [Auricularia subglabra TFB-10046 SS5]
MTAPQGIADQGVNVLFTSIALICQTFFFAYVVKRTRGPRTHWLLYCTLFAFSLSAAFWGISVANLLLRIHGFFIRPSVVLAQDLDIYGSVGNAVVLINYVITDGIVVWRAWVLCRAESGRALYLPLALFALTCRRRKPGTTDGFTHAIDVTQIAGLSLSLLTNLSATTLIALKTWLAESEQQSWKHREAMQKFIRAAQRVGNRAGTILALLVESGFIYCLIGIVVIIATVTRLPQGGTLGDLLLPSAAQITGIYPTIVIIVVSLRVTIDETVFDTAQSSTLNIAPPARSVRSTGHSQLSASPTGQGTFVNRKTDARNPVPQLHITKESARETSDTDMDDVPLVNALDSFRSSESGDSDSRVPRRRKEFGEAYNL